MANSKEKTVYECAHCGKDWDDKKDAENCCVYLRVRIVQARFTKLRFSIYKATVLEFVCTYSIGERTFEFVGEYDIVGSRYKNFNYVDPPDFNEQQLSSIHDTIKERISISFENDKNSQFEFELDKPIKFKKTVII